MLRVQVRGKRRDIGLGSISDLTLEEARYKSRVLRKISRVGADSIAARDKRDEAPPSLKAAAEACYNALSKGWTERHGDSFLATLRLHVSPR